MCVQINLKIMKKLQDYDSQKSSYHIVHKQVIPRDSSLSFFSRAYHRATKGDEKRRAEDDVQALNVSLAHNLTDLKGLSVRIYLPFFLSSYYVYVYFVCASKY